MNDGFLVINETEYIIDKNSDLSIMIKMYFIYSVVFMMYSLFYKSILIIFTLFLATSAKCSISNDNDKGSEDEIRAKLQSLANIKNEQIESLFEQAHSRLEQAFQQYDEAAKLCDTFTAIKDRLNASLSQNIIPTLNEYGDHMNALRSKVQALNSLSTSKKHALSNAILAALEHENVLIQIFHDQPYQYNDPKRTRLWPEMALLRTLVNIGDQRYEETVDVYHRLPYACYQDNPLILTAPTDLLYSNAHAKCDNVTLVTELSKRGDKGIEWVIEIANNKRAQGDNVLAAEYYRLTKPKSCQSFLLNADYHYSRENYETAAHYYDFALDLNPALPSSIYMKAALVHRALNQNEKAFNLLAIANRPHHNFTSNNE